MDRSSRNKTHKAAQGLNETLDQMYLIDIHRTYLKTTNFTFFSSSRDIIQDRSHFFVILAYRLPKAMPNLKAGCGTALQRKSSLGNVLNIEIVSSIFF